MGSISNRSAKAERANQKKVQDRRADLLGRPGMNKAHQEKPVESNRATGHVLDRGVEKNTEGLDKKL
jgi:hypothetical protein